MLFYFKGRDLVFDKVFIFSKERVKLEFYLIKIRVSSSFDNVFDGDIENSDVFFIRFYSFSLFGSLESDEDLGIEGVFSFRSNSMVIELDGIEIFDRELFFNWFYYSTEDLLLGGNII